jgi:hypothetical protein
MWKSLAVALVLAIFVTPALVNAQQEPAAKVVLRPAAISSDDAAAYFDARVAAVKVGLKLTPEQEKTWPAVEAAIRDMHQQQINRTNKYKTVAATDPASARDPIVIMRRRADMMADAAAALKQFADIAEPFYRSLDDAQKNRLRVLLVGLNSRR